MFFDKHRFNEMFHVKHFILFVFTFVSMLFVNIKVYAATGNIPLYNDSDYAFWVIKENQNLYYEGYGTPYFYDTTTSWNVQSLNGKYIYSGTFNPNPPFVNGTYDGGVDISRTATFNKYFNYTVYWIKGNYVNESTINFVIYTPVEDPWYKKLWDKFIDELDRENTALQDAVENVGKMISTWWDKITGQLPDHDGIHGKFGVVDLATPTPLPTPTPKPTPIPYSTVIKNDGQGNSTIVYKFNNPEGTPTESPVNPNINYNYNNSININGGDRNNPIYVQDVGNPEFTSIIDLSDNTISVNIGNLDDSIDSFTDPIASNVEDVGKISDVFSVFPDELMITIGCIACISLVAGIIGRFLK